MRTYKELLAEFNRAVALLQESCPHEETESEWLYSVGLGCSGKAKVCLRCEKVLAREHGPIVKSTTTFTPGGLVFIEDNP